MDTPEAIERARKQTLGVSPFWTHVFNKVVNKSGTTDKAYIQEAIKQRLERNGFMKVLTSTEGYVMEVQELG